MLNLRVDHRPIDANSHRARSATRVSEAHATGHGCFRPDPRRPIARVDVLEMIRECHNALTVWQTSITAHRLRIVKIRVQRGQPDTKLQDVDASPLHQWRGRRLHDLHLTADIPQLHDKQLTGDIKRPFERIPSVDTVFRAFADNMPLNTDRTAMSHGNIAKPTIRPCLVFGLQGRANAVEQS